MRRMAVAVAVVLAAVGLAACTGSSSSSSGGAMADSAKHAGGSAAGGAAAAPQPASGDASVARALLPDSAAKIRVAQMTVDVPRGGVPAAADRASAIALGAGGEVDSDDRSSGRYATASLQLRVPPESLPAVLRQLSRLGHEVSRQSSTTDVSQKVADVDSRVRSAQDSITRLRTLYASATRVADIIAIESELNTREADLESLQAQQRTLARQTGMATITLTLQTAAAAHAKPATHRGGFVGGLERGWDGFVAAAGWVAAAFGTLLPFLALLALLALAARPLWRRWPRHPHPTPAE